jgi:hypothetical protein
MVERQIIRTREPKDKKPKLKYPNTKTRCALYERLFHRINEAIYFSDYEELQELLNLVQELDRSHNLGPKDFIKAFKFMEERIK